MLYLKLLILIGFVIGSYFIISKIIVPAILPDSVDKSISEEYNETQENYENTVETIKKKAAKKAKHYKENLEEVEKINDQLNNQ